MKTYTINLIRHGLTDGNLKGTYTGREDVSVNAQGIKELEYLKGQFEYPQVGAVFVSPLVRCKQTAAVLYPGAPLLEIPGLTEYDFGEFEGKTPEELKDDKRYAEWVGSAGEAKAPFGESNDDFVARVAEAFCKVVEGMLKTSTTTASIVTHGGVIMAILSMFGLPEAPMHEWISTPGEGYTIRITPSLWTKGQKFEVIDTFPETIENRRERLGE